MSFITLRLMAIILLFPVRPPILIPLNTLDGSEEAPNDPGCLSLLCCP